MKQLKTTLGRLGMVSLRNASELGEISRVADATVRYSTSSAAMLGATLSCPEVVVHTHFCLSLTPRSKTTRDSNPAYVVKRLEFAVFHKQC